MTAPLLAGFTAGLLALMHGYFHNWLAVSERVKRERMFDPSMHDAMKINGTEPSETDL